MDQANRESNLFPATKPLKLEPCRVWRSFLGGRLLDEWRGQADGQDTHLPEDWLGSTVKARNAGREDLVDEGYSYVAAEDGSQCIRVRLKDLIENDPAGFLGEEHIAKYGSNSGILVKLVDSAQRLTIQVHPTEEAARALFDYPSGKTEAWYIVKTRTIDGVEPYVLLGFKEGITRKKWLDVYQRQDIPQMIELMHTVPVKPGDMLLVNSGMPHGMGEGVLFVEIQEPCDITFRTERATPAGVPLSEEACSLGVGIEAMMDQFDYTGYSFTQLLSAALIQPRLIAGGKGWSAIELIGPAATDRFSLYKLTCQQTTCDFSVKGHFVLLVDQGDGWLMEKTGRTRLKKGETYFIPAGVQDITWQSDERMELILSCPPV